MATANLAPAYQPMGTRIFQYPVSKMDYIRTLSVAFWIVSLTFGFWKMGSYYDSIAQSTRDAMTVYSAIGFSFALLTHLTLGMNRLTASPFLPPYQELSSALLSIFCLLMLVLAPLSLFPLHTAGYAVLTLGTFCMASWVWNNDYRAVRFMLILTAALLLLVLFLIFMKHGFSRGSVGGINRNRYAGVAMVAIMCCFFGNGKIKWIGLLAGLPFILMVTSRSGLLAVGVFATAYLALNLGIRRFLPFAVLGAVVLVAVILSGRGMGGKQDLVISKILMLDSAERGLQSGLTGRTDRWKEGFQTFRKSPVIGHGFRTRRNISIESKSAHNGYINLALDSGLLGIILVGAAFTTDFFRRLSSIVKVRRMLGNQKIPDAIADRYNVSCLACAAYLTMALYWISEPNYLNLGTPWVVLFFLLITSPRLANTEFYQRMQQAQFGPRLQRAW